MRRQACNSIVAARRRGGRVVADRDDGGTQSGNGYHVIRVCRNLTSGETNLFINARLTGFECVDALLTNFHLPGVNPVDAGECLCGLRAAVMSAYQHAIKERTDFTAMVTPCSSTMPIRRDKRQGRDYEVQPG